jgi:hypothetical protein
MDFIVSYQLYSRNRAQAIIDLREHLIADGEKTEVLVKAVEVNAVEVKAVEVNAVEDDIELVMNNCCKCGQDPYFCQCNEIIKLMYSKFNQFNQFNQFNPEKDTY